MFHIGLRRQYAPKLGMSILIFSEKRLLPLYEPLKDSPEISVLRLNSLITDDQKLPKGSIFLGLANDLNLELGVSLDLYSSQMGDFFFYSKSICRSW